MRIKQRPSPQSCVEGYMWCLGQSPDSVFLHRESRVLGLTESSSNVIQQDRDITITGFNKQSAWEPREASLQTCGVHEREPWCPYGVGCIQIAHGVTVPPESPQNGMCFCFWMCFCNYEVPLKCVNSNSDNIHMVPVLCSMSYVGFFLTFISFHEGGDRDCGNCLR